MMANEARRSARDGTPPERYRTCCDCCHVKFGTVALGCIELLLAGGILIGMVQQLMWKSQHSDLCYKNVFRDCLIFKFSHFNVTLIFDYIIALMMIFILVSVLLMFCGILSDTACLMIPHLIVQAFFLLFSLGYFFLYAWSYFYGDLYTHRHDFTFQAFVERMWLATVLVILAAFQTYLFTAVVRCSLYLNKLDTARRRRESAFERCSERVRLAKENGLWRTSSWGGGFMQYKGQYDETKPLKEKKNKKPDTHVQWGSNIIVQEVKMDNRMRAIEERYELPLAKPEQPFESSPPRERPPLLKQDSKDEESLREPYDRSRFTTPGTAREVNKKNTLLRHSSSTSSPKKDRTRTNEFEMKEMDEGMRKSSSSPKKDSRSSSGSPRKDDRTAHEYKRTDSKTSSSSTQKSAVPPVKTSKSTEPQGSALAAEIKHHRHNSTSHKSHIHRPPLRANKSVDSSELPASPEPARVPNHERRRSSLDEHKPTPRVVRTQPTEHIRVDSPHTVFKKISITSTGMG